MKTVALFDHYTEGHHKAFIKLFTKYMIKAGYSVCVFFPGGDDSLDGALGEYVGNHGPVRVVDFTPKRKCFRRLGRFNHAASVASLWATTKKTLTDAEKKFDIKFDLVFLAWLDDYLANYLPPQAVDLIFPYKWSGLYFHPWYLLEKGTTERISLSSIDSALRARNCLSVAVHDEFITDKLVKRIKKKVVFFPEIADATPPLPDYEVASRVRKLANGRTSIGLIGLAKRKGTLHFVSLARQADPHRFFFFMGGKLPYEDYTGEEQVLLRAFVTELPEHCYHFPEPLEEGAKINAVIDSLDILFVVYDNFKSSSNFNTKAAHFMKPVLATNRYWIGRVTEKFAMGVTVEEGNTTEALQGLETLREKLLSRTFDFSRYNDYLFIHREENLAESFINAFENHG